MLGQLTHRQIFKLARLGLLLKLVADTLSDFEAETVRLVLTRWLDDGRETLITDSEWVVLDDALTAMDAARAARFGRAA